ncbi:unnamed protein product [Medioppia subpectinata]|uniref:PHD-type domain-containing protein n=1 Tax=Medioppia subpectinata TaxID=1979941 RepID=A0A7R9Q714_9ACAR|nr:unnamed protein product [Medioppia subpectinata]CAG2115086.1 unnamed protein product [Medioppia subpectinata]
MQHIYYQDLTLEELTKKTLQYTPLSCGLSPQGFHDEIRFNICMSTIGPHCVICNLLKPYQLMPNARLSDLESWSPPKSSQILIPSLAFTSKVKDENTLLDSRDTSPLIVCIDCRICVHSVCYGVSNLLFDGSERNWRCDRCINREFFAFCSLCPIRGGPLKQTTEICGEKQWVHISCALLIPDVKFVNGIDKKPIDLSELKKSRRTDRAGCIYCRKENPDNKMVDYFSGYCVQCKCFASFHVTCGHRNGVVYAAGDWPEPITIACKKCSNVAQNNKKKLNDRVLNDVQNGETVIARHKNSRFYKAKIVNKIEQVFHHVHFDDNSFTEQLKGSDFLNRNCEEDPPEIGDAVEVIWNKEHLHGNYTGRHSFVVYAIAFDDESLIKVKREDFYQLTEDLPRRVKYKLSKATERQYGNSEDSNSLESRH